MKISYLYINGYKNLNEFEMNIEHNSLVNAIIGINGSGKSNILEALTKIFVLALTNSDEHMFIYDLRYLLDGHSVKISNKKETHVITKDGKRVYKKDVESILPRNIFLYYSGETSRLRELTEGTIDKRFERILKKDEDIALKYTTYLSERDFGASLLSNFVFKNQTFDKVCELVNLTSIEMPVKFKLKRPSWGRKNQVNEFWGAKDTVGHELRKLSDKGNFEVLDADTASIEIYDIDKLRDDSIGAIGLFTLLKVLDQAEVLDKIEFDIIKDGNNFDFGLLSEGEKQLSQLLSILEITKDYKAIFLLDEIDSYLHPKWQRMFVEILNEIDIRGQIIFTTHSPLTLGKMESDNIILLRDGKAYSPASQTINRDVTEILEEIMEVGKRPEAVEKLIKDFNRAVVKKDLEGANTTLKDLNEMLSEDDPFFVSAKISMSRLNRGNSVQFIGKFGAPDSFQRYKRRSGASFDDLSNNHYDIKQQLRKHLLIEQGYICCYCGKEIDMNTSVMEHMKDREHHPNLQLDYKNLVCSCMGGQNKRTNNPQYPLSCDACKGKKEIFVYPTDIDCYKKFAFDEDGNIYGVDEDAEKTIKELNLDNIKLNNLRKAAIDAYRYYQDDDIDWSEEIQRLKSPNDTLKYEPFCFVVRFYIENFRLEIEDE